jgi:hypothetical protein
MPIAEKENGRSAVQLHSHNLACTPDASGIKCL